ncbi:hypothetical protein BU24DRAFT_481483 [Aaosphaeria arxii CBS 175.79]|uniref:Xylanolytic transcriptional activator regulatory domain-containing protein n=1 Tax=Aaosphaeria arxii CBS 175.79 TaxID=1450172 RepID=A0A6A5XMY7_9PLEO|nr:uncharacterized protein BU24DRAFT_481483 [Aaosphaeria arxii CBS 175.79]KAF2014110.1 hypothetical protein BU24DRAFT_481483 [Aaosphaeria arxii CBS 175.79]
MFQLQSKQIEVHISDEYEKKIDRIEDRLAGIEAVLEKLTVKLENIDLRKDSPEQGSQGRSYKASRSPNSIAEVQVGTPAAFEGETTMHTQSSFAREVLEKAIGSTPSISQNAEIKATLNSLQDMVGRQNVLTSASTEAAAFFEKRLSENEATNLDRPPWDIVESILDRAATQPTMCLAVIFPFLNLQNVKTMMREVYDTPEECSPCRRIFCYGVLYNLFTEFVYYDIPQSEMEDYPEYTRRSRVQMEMGMSQLDLLIPASYENIQALLMAASYTVEIAKPSLCWIMNSTAIGLATSLGYHRISSMKDDSAEERAAKIHSFWFIYTLDKMLSLRLGRASLIQDWDMSLPFVVPGELGRSANYLKGFEIQVYWIKVAQIQGRIYEQLFSPASFLRPHEERARIATELVDAMNQAWSERGNGSIIDFVDRGYRHRPPSAPSRSNNRGPPIPEFNAGGTPGIQPSASHSSPFSTASSRKGCVDFDAIGDVFYYSDVVLHYSNTSLIQRAMSADNVSFSEECLESSRAALSAHQSCSKQFNHKGNEVLWTGYVHWAILQAPFTPFIVLFTNAVTHCHEQDLYSLSEFVLSLETCRSTSEGADKLYKMCHLFLLVAKHYIEAKTKEAEAHRSTADPVGFYGTQRAQNDFSGINVNQFDPYLSALGLAPNTTWPVTSYAAESSDHLNAFDGVAMGQNTVQDWFSGSRYIMGLMEGDDISMPDITLPRNM